MKSVIFITLIAAVLGDKPNNAYLPPTNTRDIGSSYLSGSPNQNLQKSPFSAVTSSSGYYDNQGSISAPLQPQARPQGFDSYTPNVQAQNPGSPVYGAPLQGPNSYTQRPLHRAPGQVFNSYTLRPSTSFYDKPQGSLNQVYGTPGSSSYNQRPVYGAPHQESNNHTPRPVYEAPFQNKPQVPNSNTQFPSPPVYGAPHQSSNNYTPRPVYGAPSQNKPQVPNGNTQLQSSPVYGSPQKGSNSFSSRPVYGAPHKDSNSYTPRPVYGAPQFTNSQPPSSAIYGAPLQNNAFGITTQRSPVYGAPFLNKPQSSLGSNSYTQEPASPLNGAPQQGHFQRPSSPVYGAPFQNQISPVYGTPSSNGYAQVTETSNGYTQRPASSVNWAPIQGPVSPVYGAPNQNNLRPSSGNGGKYNGRSQSAEAQSSILRSNNNNDGSGYYQFDFETENQITRQEVGEVKNLGPEGTTSVQGSYSYVGPDGHNYIVNYIADENGFQPQGEHISTPVQKASTSRDGKGSFAGANRQYLPPNKATGYNY